MTLNSLTNDLAPLEPASLYSVALSCHAELTDTIQIALVLMNASAGALYVNDSATGYPVAVVEPIPGVFRYLEDQQDFSPASRAVSVVSPTPFLRQVNGAEDLTCAFSAPLVARTGVAIGRFVIISDDCSARSDAAMAALERLAGQVVLMLEVRASRDELKEVALNRRRVIQILEERSELMEIQIRESGVQRQELETAVVESNVGQTIYEFASQRFLELFQSLPVATYCFDNEGRIIEWNRAFDALYAASSRDLLQRCIWDAIGTDESKGELKTLVDRIFSGESIEAIEMFTVDSIGETKDVMCSAFPLKSANGTVVGGISASVDITGRKAAERALQESELRFRAVTESAHDSIVTCSEDGRIVFWNHAAATLFRYDTDHALQLTLQDILPGLSNLMEPDVPGAPLRWGNCMNRTVESFAQCLRHHDVAVEVTVATWKANGRPYYTAIIRDITIRHSHEALMQQELQQLSVYSGELEFHKGRLEEINTKLEVLAKLDGMTGLKNHAAFQEKLASELCRATKYTMPLAIIMLDVDRFKDFNDAFGHVAGDEVLKRVADLLKSTARSNDFVARYGGEEFVILLPNTTLDGAAQMAERFRRSIEEVRWPNRSITASLGVAALNGRSPEAAAFVADADRALYRAKTDGRNKICYDADAPASQVAA